MTSIGNTDKTDTGDETPDSDAGDMVEGDKETEDESSASALAGWVSMFLMVALLALL